MSRITKLMTLIVIFILSSSSCNMPSSAQGPQGPDAVLTAAALTVEANLTQSVPSGPSSGPSSVTNTPTTLLPGPATATNIPPIATATDECDKAQFVTDVTIPDGTTLSPNETFTKTWRLKNIGTCSWTSSYAVVFSSGESMNGPSTQALSGNVNPGQTMDLSVNLKAPSSNGNYKGYWKLRNASGVLFAQFYVDIKVSGGGGSGTFAVTSVSYTLSTWGDAGHVNCPRVIASITTNKPGTVTFKWRRKDTPAGGATQTLIFNTAGTKTVEYDWVRGSVWAGTPTWVGIYIDDPNHQNFGEKDFSTACTVP